MGRVVISNLTTFMISCNTNLLIFYLAFLCIQATKWKQTEICDLAVDMVQFVSMHGIFLW